jgi:diguanylate cyclase (GGDEF)-like protein/PAS domain S-box-containing protein
MNPSLAQHSPTPDDSGRWRVKLARKWAYLITATAYLPLPHAELEDRLLELVDVLATVLTAEPSGPGGPDQRAAEIGSRLVAMHCTGPDSLRRTLDVLGRDLLAQPELRRLPGLPERVVAVLGAIAAGYSEALRVWVFEQQESVNGAFVELLRDTNRSLAASEARFDLLSRLSPSGVAVTDREGRVLRCNSALCTIVDLPMDEVIGRRLLDFFVPGDVAGLGEIYGKLREGPAATFRRRRCAVRRDGESAEVFVSGALVREEDPEKFVTILEDESDLSLLQERIAHQSLHDVDTRLPNRQYFSTQLEKMLRRADPELGVTLYHLDLDAFSVITGGVGYQAGLQLLRETGVRLADVFAGEEATLARVGADEFAVLVRNSATTPNVVTMVGRINEALSEPLYVGGQGVATSACVGVVHQPPLDTPPKELLRNSEVTLRRARALGRRQWALFDAGDHARDTEDDALAAAMPGAWESGEITVVYRPVVHLPDGRPAAVEAMLRWARPGFGVLSHERCVELAERTGLILSLGAWALRKACEEVALFSDVPVAVSLSRSQASDPDLTATVLAALEGIGLSGDRVLLTLPLSELLDERGDAAESLRVLSDLGIGAGVAGFDGGPADLAYLDELPVTAVHLAPRLVETLTGRTDRPPVTRVLETMIELVRSSGKRIVVSGITTADQADWWGEAGADFATGSAYGEGEDLHTVLGEPTTP